MARCNMFHDADTVCGQKQESENNTKYTEREKQKKENRGKLITEKGREQGMEGGGQEKERREQMEKRSSRRRQRERQKKERQEKMLRERQGRINQAKVKRRREEEEEKQRQEREEKEGPKTGKRERQEREAERQGRTEKRRRRRREEAERKEREEREEIERLKRGRQGCADKMKRRKEEREGQDQEERVTERKNDAEKLRTTEGNETFPKKSLISNVKIWYLEHQKNQIIKAISRSYEKEVAIDVGDDTPEVKDIRIWREQAKRMKLLLEKQTVEQKIRHERKGQGSNEKEGESQRREVALKQGFVSKLKTRYLELKMELIIKSISRMCQQEMAINAGDDAPEVKEIRKWRQLAHRRKLIEKLDEIEEKINRRRDKGRKKKTQEERDEEDEKAGSYSKVVTALFEECADLNMAVLKSTN